MKWIIRLVIVLAVLVIAVGVLLVMSVDRIARSAIEIGGTEVLGTKTTLKDIRIGILGGKASLGGLAVANPTGYPEGDFLSLDRGSVAVSLGSLSGQTVEIPRLELNGIGTRLDMKLGEKSNAETVLANVEAFTQRLGGGGGSAPAEGGGKTFVIRELVLTDIAAKVSVADAAAVDVKVPRIELRDVGGGKGVSMSELFGIVTTVTVEGILDAGGNLIPAALRDSLGPKVAEVSKALEQGIGGALGTMTEGASKAVEGAVQGAKESVGQAVEDAAKKAEDSLKKGVGDLFKKN